MKLVRILFLIALVGPMTLTATIAQAQTCSTPEAQLISPPDGSTLQADPVTGLVSFTWCNASADYFVTIETIPGAHDLFFAFAGGPGGAGLTTLTLGPACGAVAPKGCIPHNGEHFTFILQTVKNKAFVGPAHQYSFTAPGAATAQPDFTIASSKPSLVVAAPGGTATTVLTVTGQAGYNGIVNFSCSALPANSTCAFEPATIAGGGSTTMTVFTTPAQTASLKRTPGQWFASLGAVSFAGLFFVGLPAHRRGGKRRGTFGVILTLVAVSLVILLVGCGGSASSATPPTRTAGTPVGTSTVVVSATDGTITHTTNVTLTVQ